MYPELFHIGSVTIYTYGFCILIGVVFGYLYFLRQSRQFGLNSDQVSELFLWCIASVFVGGKLFFYLEDPGIYLKNPGKMLENPGEGFVFYGSFIATVPVLIWWFRKHKLNSWEMFDLVGVSGALVHAFGKIGCFMAGCCHGKVCSPAWGVIYRNPHTHAEPTGVPLYPVQLWDSAMIFATIGVMLWMRKRKQFHGQLFLIYGLVYAFGRYVTEIFRGDTERGFLFGGSLSHSQFIAIIIFAICLFIYIRRLKSAPIQHIEG